jgi:itaconate CoA-transferase
MYAFSSILAALLRRERTGEGATIDVTMLEALGEWMGFPAYFTAYGGAEPPRSGAHHATIVPYGPFRAADGQAVFISVQNEREFASFCEQVLRKPELARDPRFASGPARFANREAVHREVDAVFSRLPCEELVARLDAADIANARLNDMSQFWRHPQLEARGRWGEVGSPAGELRVLKPPVNLAGMDPDMRAIPAAGQHTESVLAELGYSAAEIGRLRREKAI